MNVEKMTLRDWFAGMALQRLIPDDGVFKGKNDPQKAAEYAYRIAEAMVQESEKAMEREEEKIGWKPGDMRE